MRNNVHSTYPWCPFIFTQGDVLLVLFFRLRHKVLPCGTHGYQESEDGSWGERLVPQPHAGALVLSVAQQIIYLIFKAYFKGDLRPGLQAVSTLFLRGLAISWLTTLVNASASRTSWSRRIPELWKVLMSLLSRQRKIKLPSLLFGY